MSDIEYGNVGISKKDMKSLKRGFKELEENMILKEQTLMFWNLQLQFMERSSRSLVDVWQGIRFDGMYKSDAFGGKMYNLVRKGCYSWTEDEHNCFATHLAIQLSGIEE